MCIMSFHYAYSVIYFLFIPSYSKGGHRFALMEAFLAPEMTCVDVQANAQADI